MERIKQTGRYLAFLYQNSRAPVHSLKRRGISPKKKVFIFAVAFLALSLGNIANADMFGTTIADVFASITKNVKDVNEIIEKAFRFAKTSPYFVVNSISGTSQGDIAVMLHTATQTAALAVASLLLMVEFFRKTVNFEWSSKWENILIFLVKIIVIKQVVQNADVIVGYIYAGFDMTSRLTGSMRDFLPCGDVRTFIVEESDFLGWIGEAVDFWSSLIKGHSVAAATASMDEKFKYVISPDAVNMFYPNVNADYFTGIGDSNGVIAAAEFEDKFRNPISSMTFNPTVELVLWQPYFLIMKAIGYIIFVITVGRVFELALYTLFAPLPIATFASEATNDVGKSFLKNYIACVLQVAVIGAMFVVFYAMTTHFQGEASTYGSIHLIRYIILIAFGLSVIKSGAWAKRICGTS